MSKILSGYNTPAMYLPELVDADFLEPEIAAGEEVPALSFPLPGQNIKKRSTSSKMPSPTKQQYK